MAPRKAKKTAPSFVDSSSDSEDNSKSDNGEDVMITARRMLDKANARRTAARKNLKNEVSISLEKSHADVDKFFAETKANVTRVQNSKFAELAALVKSRRDIMAHILKLQANVKASNRQMAKELAAVYKDRVDAIRELEDQEKTLI